MFVYRKFVNEKQWRQRKQDLKQKNQRKNHEFKHETKQRLHPNELDLSMEITFSE